MTRNMDQRSATGKHDFHSTLKVDTPCITTLAMLQDSLVAAESPVENEYAMPQNDNLTNCCCSLKMFSRLGEQSPFTSIPYSHILATSIHGSKLKITYASPKSSSSPRGCFKSALKISYTEFTISDTDLNDRASSWVNALAERAYPKSAHRRRIFVILNPFGGKGDGLVIWKDEIQPFLLAAGCKVEMHETTHRGHATELARNVRVGDWDLVVCCSGDGVVHEVFNGFAQQKNPSQVLASIPVVQLPCGSGNAMSYNMMGTVEPSAATLALLKGDVVPLDLMSVTHDGKRSLSFLSQSVGMIADCDVGTENVRWLGPARFKLGVVFNIMMQSVYPCDIAFPASSVSDKSILRDQFFQHTNNRLALPNKATNTNKTDSSQAPLQSPVLNSMSDWPNVSPRPEPPMRTHYHEADGADSSKVPLLDIKADNENDLSFGTHRPSLPDGLPSLRYGTVEDPLPGDWIRLSKPDLGAMYAGNMAFMADDAHFFPVSRPADGKLDIVIFSGKMGRLRGLHAVTAIDNGPKFFDLSVIDYVKTDAFRIIPHQDESSHISIDGEPFKLKPFQTEVHPGLGRSISMFGQNAYVSGSPWPQQG